MARPPGRILVIETSSRWGSAAIGTHDGIVAAGDLNAPMRHAADFVELVRRLLDENTWDPASISDVFVSVGPGSFTGLRIGITLARTLSWSTGARIVAVPTLDALARNALQAPQPPAHLAVVLDAKRNQVYTAAFECRNGELRRLAGPTLAEPALFLAGLPRPLAILGEGIPFHRAAIDAADLHILPEPLWRPQVAQIFSLGLSLSEQGHFTPGPDLLPLYIRRPEAEEKWEILHPPLGK